MIERILQLVLSLYWLASPIGAILLPYYVATRLKRDGMHPATASAAVLGADALAFFPAVIGTEGFALPAPWFFGVFWGFKHAHFPASLWLPAALFFLVVSLGAVALVWRRKDSAQRPGGAPGTGTVFRAIVWFFAAILGCVAFLFL